MENLNIWWTSMNFEEQLFWGIAMCASVVFSFQFAMSLIGIDSDMESDGGIDGDGDFALFSLRSVVAFFLFFGWTGVLMTNKGLPIRSVILIAFCAGLVAMLIVAYILFKLFNMTEIGNVNMENAIGLQGEVYIPIPEKLHGKGKILLDIENKTMELLAVTNGTGIATGATVVVNDLLEDNVLLVQELKT